MRIVFFGLTALWGYAIGAATLLGALSATGQTYDVDTVLLSLGIPGALVAFVGGMIAAAAYREVRRRRSS